MKAEYLEFSTKGNSRRKALREQVLLQNYNLLCYSRNLLMTEPKEGMAYEWDNVREKSLLFSQLLNEQPDGTGVAYYCGVIDEWVQLGELCFIRFKIANAVKDTKQAPTIYFKVPLPLYMEWVDKYKAEIVDREYNEKPIIIRLQIKEGMVYEIKWADEWN